MNIKDYLKYYIGCPALNTWFPIGHKLYDKAWVLKGVEYGGDIARYFLENEKEETWTDSVMPILRRIESLTEAELIGMLMAMESPGIHDKPTLEDYSMEVFHNDGGNLVDVDVSVGADYSCRCYEGQVVILQNGDIDFYDTEGEVLPTRNLTQGIHYLLSLGIDLFGLLDAGLAIDAATINQQTEGK